MFDDPKLQKQPASPAAGPTAKLAGPSANVPNVEDIFAKTTPSAGQAKQNVQPAAPLIAAPALGGALPKPPLPAPVASKKGIFVALAIIVVVAILAAAGWFVYDMIKTGQSINKGIETLKQTTPPTEASKVAPAPVIPAPAPVVEPETTIVDSDSDGLIDSEEMTYGANPQKADTDDDGLTDKEEVKIYQTDPLNADTDGDKYSDGEEVKNGYNPNGTGKLLDFEKAKKALQGVE